MHRIQLTKQSYSLRFYCIHNSKYLSESRVSMSVSRKMLVFLRFTSSLLKCWKKHVPKMIIVNVWISTFISYTSFLPWYNFGWQFRQHFCFHVCLSCIMAIFILDLSDFPFKVKFLMICCLWQHNGLNVWKISYKSLFLFFFFFLSWTPFISIKAKTAFPCNKVNLHWTNRLVDARNTEPLYVLILLLAKRLHVMCVFWTLHTFNM